MNTFTKTLATITLSLSAIGMANATSNAPLFAADDSISTNLCVVAAQGSKIDLHKAIKDSGLRKSFIAEEVKCNEQSILSFVQDYAQDPEAMNSILTGGKYKTQVDITDLANVKY